MANIDLETEEILKNAGLSTEEPDDVLAPQEPQVTEMGKIGRPVQAQGRSDQVTDPRKAAESVMGLGQDEYAGFVVKDTFIESLLGMAIAAAYGTVVSDKASTQLAVSGNAALNSVASVLGYRAMMDPKTTGFQKVISGAVMTLTGISALLSVTEAVKATPRRKLKPITVPAIIKDLAK